MKSASRIIVALDVSTLAEAEQIESELDGLGVGFKVGMQLYTAEGPATVRNKDRRFLDL